MKLTPRTKKLLMVLGVLVIAVSLTGCTIPHDENGKIILIETSTTFSEVMSNENWFSSIFVWPVAQWINHMAPVIGVGLSIVVVTVVINGVLALLTLKSTVSMQQMQLIQPELAKIQRKYEGRDDDASRMRQAQEMQKLYKDYQINPAGSLLVTFIQLPVIMAMYMAVQRSAAVATGTFLGMDLQVTPLAGIQQALQGNKASWMYLALFIVMALCQFASMYVPQFINKQRAKKEAEKHHRKPEKTSSSQQTIMQVYMMGMILVFGLMWASAMSLYWAINSLVNVIKTLAVQKYIDNQKEKKVK